MIKTTLALLILFLFRKHVVFAFVPPNHQVSHSYIVGSRLRIRTSPLSPKQHNNPPPPSVEKTPSTITTLAASPTENQSELEPQPSLFNTRLALRIALNQALIGYTIWNGGLGAQVLARDGNLSSGWILGILGVVPLLAVSLLIETSESPLFSDLNQSTNVLVLRLFGSKPKPIVALGVSAFLAVLTGVAEEVTFRGEVLPTLAQWSVTNLGVSANNEAVLYGAALSTIIFAALHVNPTGLLRGKDAAVDCLVLFALQLVTGSTFPILFLTTENLCVAIVAHAVYDFYTFYKTHLDVTTQMEYATRESLMPVGRNVVEKKWIEERGDEFVQGVRETFYLMDVNRDGMVSRKELRIALNSYGINLTKMDSEMVLEAADEDDSGDISFDEFLNFVGPEGSPGKAVQRSLLGVS